MKPLIVLRRFLHQLPVITGGKRSIKQAVLQKDNFSLLPLAIFIQQKAQPAATERQRSTPIGEMAEL